MIFCVVHGDFSRKLFFSWKQEKTVCVWLQGPAAAVSHLAAGARLALKLLPTPSTSECFTVVLQIVRGVGCFLLIEVCILFILSPTGWKGLLTRTPRMTWFPHLLRQCCLVSQYDIVYMHKIVHQLLQVNISWSQESPEFLRFDPFPNLGCLWSLGGTSAGDGSVGAWFAARCTFIVFPMFCGGFQWSIHAIFGLPAPLWRIKLATHRISGFWAPSDSFTDYGIFASCAMSLQQLLSAVARQGRRSIVEGVHKTWCWESWWAFLLNRMSRLFRFFHGLGVGFQTLSILSSNDEGFFWTRVEHSCHMDIWVKHTSPWHFTKKTLPSYTISQFVASSAQCFLVICI